MKLTVRKGLLKPLTVAEFRENAGTKIKRMGADRRAKLRLILSDAMNRGSTVGSTAKRLSEKANTPKKTDKRDWIRVVQTEYTDAKAIASLDLIQAVFGDDASVFRDPAEECCEKCSKALKGKKFAVNKVPRELRGALHPRCVCPPWQAVERPDLTKAMDPLADIPIGVVKRVPDGVGYAAEVSTGNGYWVRLDSATGKSIIRVMLIHTPVIEIGEKNGLRIYQHGHAKATGKPFTMYDLGKMGSARFYPFDLTHFDHDMDHKEKMVTGIADLAQYVAKIQAALPTVAVMPEYWDTAKWRYITDFLGYKTLTDYLVVSPGAPALAALIGKFSPKQVSIRRAVRGYAAWSLKQGSLKKVQR